MTNGYTQLALRTNDVNKLRQLKALGIIPSMSGFLHFLIVKEIQELKKQQILKKRQNIKEKNMELKNNSDYAMELYINNYNDYMKNLNYTPVYNNDEIMGWER